VSEFPSKPNSQNDISARTELVVTMFVTALGFDLGEVGGELGNLIYVQAFNDEYNN
jgi:hypothetical protein